MNLRVYTQEGRFFPDTCTFSGSFSSDFYTQLSLVSICSTVYNNTINKCLVLVLDFFP